MSIRLKLSLLMAFLFLAAMGNSVFTFWLESFGQEQLRWVNHTHEVINVKENFLGAMTDAETGQRGYLLTTVPAYLEPYYKGVSRAEDDYQKLKELTSDNPKQQEILHSIEENIELKLAELKETIELTQNGKRDEALEIVKANKGKLYMDSIRERLARFHQNELILLEKRKGDFRENRAHITTLVAVELLFFMGLAVTTLTFLQKNFFLPLKMLLSNAKKVEEGQKIQPEDIVEKDEMGHLLSTFFLMSEKVYEREKALGYRAHHDELTGLKNRITLYDEIDMSVSESKGTGAITAVLFMDLNLFKQVNDTLGHDVGDLLLKETAERLNASVRSNDVVFRVGGDEFVVLLKNIHNPADLRQIVEKICRAFEKPTNIKGNSIKIATSIGVALAPADATDSNDLVKYADIAMYAAKRDPEIDYKLFDQEMLKRASDHG